MTRPRMSDKPEVHRDLRLVTPELSGADVKALQERLNHQCEHYRFPWRRISEDGEYGRRTQRCAKFVAWLIGLDEQHIDGIGSKSGHIGEAAQQVLRDPKKRSEQDRMREDSRKNKREMLHKAHEEGPKAAVEWALDQVGIKEKPENSNRGTEVDKWSALFGLSGEPWCGIFVGYAVKHIGKANSNAWFPAVMRISNEAIAGVNNLRDIAPADAQPGDIATLYGNTHVGLVRSKPKNGMVSTVEGNTSSMLHDADGGIVEAKEHPIGDVTTMVRVEWS